MRPETGGEPNIDEFEAVRQATGLSARRSIHQYADLTGGYRTGPCTNVGMQDIVSGWRIPAGKPSAGSGYTKDSLDSLFKHAEQPTTLSGHRIEAR